MFLALIYRRFKILIPSSYMHCCRALYLSVGKAFLLDIYTSIRPLTRAQVV